MTNELSSHDPRALLAPLRRLHEAIRAAVVEACERSSLEALAAVERDDEGDTIYAVDRVGEEVLIDFFGREVAPAAPLVLIAEGLRGGQVVLPRGASERDAVWRVIVDPIDGTRGLMYQKRSAWVLTGVAPNRGPGTSLADIELALQTEIPLVKQHLSDVAWALARGICCHPYDLCTELIAREAGVVVTGVDGGPLDARLAVEPDVAWAGYANAGLREQIEPLLRAALERRGLWRGGAGRAGDA